MTVSNKSKRYSDKTRRLAINLLHKHTLAEVAKKIGTTPGTICLWRKKKEKEEAENHHADSNGNSFAGENAATRNAEEDYAVIYLFSRFQREIEIYANNSLALIPSELAHRVGELLQRTALRGRVRPPNRMPLLRG